MRWEADRRGDRSGENDLSLSSEDDRCHGVEVLDQEERRGGTATVATVAMIEEVLGKTKSLVPESEALYRPSCLWTTHRPTSKT